MLGVLKLSLDTGGGDLKNIRLADGIRLVKHRVYRAVEGLTVVDIDALLVVKSDAQIFVRALLYELNVPDEITHLLGNRSDKLADR